MTVNRRLFEVHASPEAIRAELDQKRARSLALQRDLEWLEGLYMRRIAEKAAGAWPAPLVDRDTGDEA